MLSNEQRLEKLKKLSLILKNLPICNSIGEISEKTQIPTSTIQRYLNNKNLFFELVNEEENLNSAEEIYEQVQEFLKKSKKDGLSKGGLKSQELYGYDKSENGRFNGNRKK